MDPSMCNGPAPALRFIDLMGALAYFKPIHHVRGHPMSKPALSRNAKRAIAKYGEPLCREAFEMTKTGDGGRIIGFSLNLTTNQADAAISAGRELAEHPLKI